MKTASSPLQSLAALPTRALVICAHAGDEVAALGGLLALQAERGDPLRVLCLQEPGRALRAAAQQASRALGVLELHFAGLGALDREEGLSESIARELAEFRPTLCYLPSPLETHPDQRAAFSAAWSALEGLELTVYAFASGATALPGNRFFDVTSTWSKQRQALSELDADGARGLQERADAFARARALSVEPPSGESGGEPLAERRVESVLDLRDPRIGALGARLSELSARAGPDPVGETQAQVGQLAATAVISTWNKKDDLRENLASIQAQIEPFENVVVVDNASSDGSAEMVAAEFPRVRLIRMPHPAYGACETFNIGFASVTTPLTAILDDDIVLPSDWLAKTRERMAQEPETTAIVSTKIVEPEMPESYRESAAVNTERYMSTFRGCGSLARSEALRAAGFYDERLFIYGNERDLTCRLLNLGYRVLQYPGVETHHKTPFGMKMGKRSLYFHARNAWLSMLKYAPTRDLVRLPWLVFNKVILRGDEREAAGGVTDATGTIGLGKALKETPGAGWVLVKAAFSVLANIPYCLKHRAPVRHEDFELPLK